MATVRPSTSDQADHRWADLVLESLKLVLLDDGFKLPSPRAVEALSSATELVAWCEDHVNQDCFSKFSMWLVNTLKTSFRVTSKVSRLRSEKIWEQYHKLRTSKPFREEWENFMMASLGQHALPTLFQYVSHRIFKELLKVELGVGEHRDTGSGGEVCRMTWEEENALRYVAGYVCRSVQKKVLKSKLHNQDEMVHCCMELCGDEEDEDRGTEEWTNRIDRGGLWHINDNTFMVFSILEEEIRRHLNVSALKDFNDKTKNNILAAIIKNEELLFQWSMVTANADDVVGTEILKRISELYLTVRGFAFANSCMEMYKQQNKKQVQKSKALRKKVAACSKGDNSD